MKHTDPGMKLKQEDLEGGTLLKQAIADFTAERTAQNLINVLELLRDSYLWVPCTTIMSEADQKAMEEMIAGVNGNLDKLAGMTYTSLDTARMVPDILHSDDGKYYFPVFTAEEDMGEYGERFSQIEQHILDIIPIAANNEHNVSGIVINAFSQQFILQREFFEVIQKMESRIAE